MTCVHFPAPLWEISVTMDIEDGGRSPLMSAASVLHRRGIDVIKVSMVLHTLRQFRFTATFRCLPSNARMVQRTFGNRVDALEVTLTALNATEYNR